MPIPENLLARCLIHDAKSQRELYDLYKARIMGLCRRYTKNKEEAEDVYQEIFIRVFQNISQLKELDHLEQWIKKIAINTAVNYYHKNKRHNHAEERNGYHHENGDYSLILSQFSDEMLIRMINELPDGYRIVFNLHEVEGYSHGEIGELLNISEATSRSQLNRAKQALKNKLKNIGVLKYERYE
jgi:RNA polymerase sigma-70 factor (ECF subfamily)